MVLIDKTAEEQNAIFESFIKTLKTADSLQFVQQERQQQLAANTSFLTVIFISTIDSARTRGESEFYRFGEYQKTDNWRYSSLQSVAFTPDGSALKTKLRRRNQLTPVISWKLIQVRFLHPKPKTA